MRCLVDEMFPAAAAELLRERHGHDAVHVTEIGLEATDDLVVAAAARSEDRVLVTGNVTDFADQRDLVLVFVRKRDLPVGGAQALGLVEVLHRWASAHPAPYRGAHWPR